MSYMGVVNVIFIYIMVWWVVIFAVLPYGNHPAEKPIIGHSSGAPANPRLKKKLIITSVISLFVTGIIFALIHYSGFSFLDSVNTWERE
ncbi:MAG: hypothetical protein JWM96_468 [Alphaproteobacteria bacterium]|nr:hypothetical protein [Alphaproteobacteria bacterium]